MRLAHHYQFLPGAPFLGDGDLWLCLPLCDVAHSGSCGECFAPFGSVLYHSDKYLELSSAINTAADRGCTVMDGHGCYSGKDVHMLFVLARQRESQKIFRLIDEIDPTAFVSQSSVIGVYGEGFDRFKVSKKKPSLPKM